MHTDIENRCATHFICQGVPHYWHNVKHSDGDVTCKETLKHTDHPQIYGKPTTTGLLTAK